MDVPPAIAALRTNRAPQRHAQSAMQHAIAQWSADPGAAAVLAELERFGAGAELEDCPQLERVFCCPDEAERLAGLLGQVFCREMAANPLAHPPFRTAFDGAMASALLARAGSAQLVLQSREPGAYPAASYGFSDGLRYDAVLGGKAQGRIVRVVQAHENTATFCHEEVPLIPGGRIALDLARELLLIEQVERRVVLLRLIRTSQHPLPSREYAADDGRLVLQTAGNLATSRQEAIIALLGRLGRHDAAPVMADVALGEGDVSLRWQALREALALDTTIGFVALLRLARRTGDALAGPAGALRAQLIEAYPQLLQLETNPCRA